MFQNPVDWKQLDYDFNIPTLPWVLGGDAAGRVYKVGAGVTAFSAGDRVLTRLSSNIRIHSETLSRLFLSLAKKRPDIVLIRLTASPKLVAP